MIKESKELNNIGYESCSIPYEDNEMRDWLNTNNIKFKTISFIFINTIYEEDLFSYFNMVYLKKHDLEKCLEYFSE